MSPNADRLNDIARECLAMLPAALPQAPSTGRSSRTEAEYLRMAQALLERANGAPGALAAAVQATQSPRTFHKRLAALRFSCRQLVREHLDVRSASQELDWQSLADVLPRLHEQLRALITLNEHGMTQPRRKRRSKRQALKGLPPSWREELCARGAPGKYADALLASALTGARPGELVKGITAWLRHDDALGIETLCLYVQGIKIKAQQGQPYRFMAYSVEDTHPLVAALVNRLSTLPDRKLDIHIAKAGNFTAEIQRLARMLWRNHDHAVTATCFRHQWSADVKAAGDADAASRGLGHRSSKTRRFYGIACQAQGAHALRPVCIEAELPLRLHSTRPHPAAHATPGLR
ncbi:integrase [Chitinimonas koreensis]|uniref:integrase n=1 Tax=Chitinimonas koreensis TaxID=356302 RepID=UPI0012FB72CF|nr:integrase [Chitinimonas koreensis]QNM97114.1 integrase [Chitinimonas koreensis]